MNVLETLFTFFSLAGCFIFQIGLYNSMVEKEGMDGEQDAIKAYRAAREESDHDTEEAEGDKVSSALIERVKLIQLLLFSFHMHLLM